jgi:hypothetical protein
MSALRAARIPAVAACLLAAWSCFEPPVTERVEIEFTGWSGATVRTLVSLRPQSELEGLPRERVARAARALVEESDAWAIRLREMEPEQDRFELGRRRGEVVEAQRTASVDRREALEALFARTPVAARYSEGTDWQEFTLFADSSGPAPAQERRKTDEELAAWAEGAASYFAAAVQLWRFVDEHPERTRSCFESVFLRGWSPAEDASEEEAALLRALEDGTGQVLGALVAQDDEEFTLSERVRRAYDPFPAPVTVRVPGIVLEAEGFPGAAEGKFAIEALDLWNAFRSLEGRWLSPDPALALWRHDAAPTKAPFDLDAFVALPRSAVTPPRASEVMSLLRAALTPAPAYRVRWRPPGEEPEREDEGR